MKFMPILISEGRKEDLTKKYEKKLDPSHLNQILDDQFIIGTNYKYADFLLRNIENTDNGEEVDEDLKIVKKFHDISKNLERKDINQYLTLGELYTAVTKYKSKTQERITENGTKKIYEDDNILVVSPKTHQSSCKYGAGTRWCTTTPSDTHFKSYTSGNQALYYIIFKNIDKSNKFYKIAIHKTPNVETWFDSTDQRMSAREKEGFEVHVHKLLDKINQDYAEIISEQDNILTQIFNPSFTRRYTSDVVPYDRVAIGFKYPYVDLESKHINLTMDIMVDNKLWDAYLLPIVFKYDRPMTYFFDISFDDTSDFLNPSVDLKLDSRNLKFMSFFENEDPENAFSRFTWKIKEFVEDQMKRNGEFMKEFTGKKVWFPNRIGYGYTFKENKGLIKKLVDYLDQGNKGTKVDFLTKIGVLDKKEFDGKPYYSHHGKNEWVKSTFFRGQLSGFFNSARLAGILDYDKEGNTFYLKKGPNFEDFKKGELHSV